MAETSGIRIVQTVASGGTAVLYKAVQTSLDRIVAVKRLHAHLTDDENFTRRFILEAKAAASLDHPNIVHVIDFGQDEGYYQMVMEFVEGESLKDVLERWRPVRYDLALAITHQILLGLEHAHARGIVHRDIKPGNVMITAAGRVKIADFGLAKLTQAASSHTAENSILGTPLYMSPEQAFGESVDQRSDLFSLGTVLFEMLTGRQPFASENYMGVIQNIINCNVPGARTLAPDIPPDVESIVTRALSKDRDRRFQSAREFRSAIEDCFGIVRLNDTRARIGALLNPDTDTRVLLRPEMPNRSAPRASRRGAFGVVAFVALAASTAVAILRPDVVDSVRNHLQDIPLQNAAVSPGVPDLDVPIAALIRADSATAPDPIEEVRDLREPAMAPGSFGGAGLQANETTAHQGGAGDSPGADTTAAQQTTPPTDATDRHPSPANVAKKTGNTAADRSKPASRRAERPAVREGYLRVHVQPTAEIYVDGVYRGDSPPELRLVLRAGQHTVECKHPRHAPYRETIRIVAGELSRRNITLEKLRGSISLATEAGARLFVDGVHVGTTPLRAPLEVDVGPHTLALKKPGYHTWTSRVTIDSGKTMRLSIKLSRQY